MRSDYRSVDVHATRWTCWTGRPRLTVIRMTERDRHTTPRYAIGVPKDEWDEFGKLVGDRNRSEVVRRFIRALIRRPGARVPKPSDFDKPPAGS
jgi:hypothetical protein